MAFRLNELATMHRLKVAGLLLAVFAAGAGMTWWIVSRADHEMREGLLLQARLVAQGVNVGRVQSLSGTDADLTNPAYLQLKEQLAATRSSYPRCRFVYLLGRKSDATVFFFVDSEPADSKDCSPPGQVYEEAPDGTLRVFAVGDEAVVGPYSDRWGNWVSAMVPIFETWTPLDKGNRKVLAVFGMDIAAQDWTRMLVLSGLLPVLLTLAMAAIFLAGSMLLARGSWTEKRPPRRIMSRELVLVVAAGIVLTLFAVWMSHDRETRSREETFWRLATSRTAVIAETLRNLCDTELEGLAHFCESNPTATLEEFKRYTAYLITNPAIQAWEWIPAVAAADKSRFEGEARTAGWKDFEIWQKDGQGRRVPATGRNIYYPVFRVTPLAGNERVAGFDAGSELHRRAALEEAARTGVATGTDPITLVQESGDQKGMLIVRPVFSGENPRCLLGFAVAVLRMGTLLGSEDPSLSLPMQLSLLRKDAAPERLASTGDAGRSFVADLSVMRPVFAFGKVFAVTICAGRDFMIPGQAGLGALLIGLLLTSALAILVGVLLRRREELVRLVAEMTKNQLIARHARDPLLLMETDGKLLEANRAAEDLYGYTHDELLQLRISDLRLQADPELIRRQQQQAVSQGILFETVHFRKDGSSVPVEVSSRGVIVDGIEMQLSVIRDITERKRAEEEIARVNIGLERRVEERTEELKRSKDQLQHLLDTAPVGVGISTDGVVRFANPRITEIVDLQIGGPTSSIFSNPEDRERMLQVLDREGIVRDWEFKMCGRNGEERDIMATFLTTEFEGRKGILCWLIDIGKLKAAEIAMREAKELAESASRTKSAFLANMSHEIRTPMNAILGFSQLMLHDSHLSARQRKHLETIGRSGEHLLALINDILDMSKIEAGRTELNPVSLDISALLHDLQTMFRVRTHTKGLRLNVIKAPDVPPFCVVDKGKLLQVLINLLGNAVKFTSKGGVVLRAILENAAPPRLIFEVEDSGTGIPEEQIGNIFQPFVQVHGEHQPGSRLGTGLGLAISLDLAHLMGGDIRVTSKVGKGSVFRFSIPFVKGGMQRAEWAPVLQSVVGLKPGQPGCRILIVDDREANKTLLSEMLDRAGFATRTASSGKDVAGLFETWHPHLILMDMRMPDMGGEAAIRWIRAADRGGDVKIISVSATSFENMRREALDAGADDFLAKPFREEELFEKIRLLLGVEYEYDQPKEDASAPPPAEETRTASPGEMASLPPDLAERIRNAAVTADYDLLLELIQGVEDKNLSRVLSGLVKLYNYQQLLALLDPK